MKREMILKSSSLLAEDCSMFLFCAREIHLHLLYSTNSYRLGPDLRDVRRGAITFVETI